MDDLYFDKSLGAESNSASFREYCKNTNYCQKIIYNGDTNNVKY